jgi:Family of unknown function (DUF5654)
MAAALSSVALQLESQSLNAIVAGFSFASAIAWMDFVRFAISKLVQVSKDGASYYALAALFTTLLSIIVYLIVKTVAFNVVIREPQAPIYAVTA